MLIAPILLILILSIVSIATPGWSGKTKGLWKDDSTIKHLTIIRCMTTMSIVVQLVLLACLLRPKPVKPALLITLVIGVLISSTISVTLYKPSHGMKKGYSYWLQVTALVLMLVIGGLLIVHTLKEGEKHSSIGALYDENNNIILDPPPLYLPPGPPPLVRAPLPEVGVDDDLPGEQRGPRNWAAIFEEVGPPPPGPPRLERPRAYRGAVPDNYYGM
mgnify:CR=1 FL=1